ncbi:MAG: class I SAM-dependent methyltransferase [Eggerthellaceae bacterium]
MEDQSRNADHDKGRSREGGYRSKGNGSHQGGYRKSGGNGKGGGRSGGSHGYHGKGGYGKRSDHDSHDGRRKGSSDRYGDARSDRDGQRGGKSDGYRGNGRAGDGHRNGGSRNGGYRKGSAGKGYRGRNDRNDRFDRGDRNDRDGKAKRFDCDKRDFRNDRHDRGGKSDRSHRSPRENDDFRGRRNGGDARSDRRFSDKRGGSAGSYRNGTPHRSKTLRERHEEETKERKPFGYDKRSDVIAARREARLKKDAERSRQDFRDQDRRPSREAADAEAQEVVVSAEAVAAAPNGGEEAEDAENAFYPEYFASCQVGLEEALGRELKSFGIKKTRPLGGGVTFYADKECAYRALLWSRLASRILLLVGRVGCEDADDLYRNIRQLPWHKILAEDAKIAVFASGTNEQLRNSHFTAQRIKDGICDKVRQVRGERPTVDAKHPDAVISVRINRSKATVSFDLAGESLYHRSYIRAAGQRIAVDVALANAMLGTVNWRTLGWRRHYRLIDPVCNNPLLVVEAAAEVADRAPGLSRSNWGFTGWGEHDADLWNRLLDEADQRFEDGLKDAAGRGASALGITRSSDAASWAADCLKAAGVEGVGQVVLVDEDTVAPAIDHAMRAATRAAESAIKRAEAVGEADKPVVRQASVVAANLLRAHDDEPGGLAKDTELFMRAAEQAPEGSVFIEIGASLGAVYGHAPAVDTLVGGKKIDAPMMLFSKPPVARKSIKVVGLEDGIEHDVPVYEEGTEQFAARLRKMAKERRKWAQALGITCYRIYDADLLDYMVAVDRYEDLDGNAYLCIAEYAAPKTVDQDRAQRRFEDVVAVAPIVLGIDRNNVYTKTRRQAKGGEQYSAAGNGSRIIRVKEGGYTFKVDLAGRLDTGLFLDHRITRHMIQERAQGKRFLNLFAYTGTGTVYAAGGGARSTVTVDLSGHYLDWARENMEANGFEGHAHRFEHADVMSWIRDARRKHRMFDLVFVDPPTFSNSKSMGAKTWDVQRDHVELLIGVSHLLETSGEAIFSCNLKGFKPNILKLAKFGIGLEDITEQTIPQDFERRMNIHKCYLVRHLSPEEREETLRKAQSELTKELNEEKRQAAEAEAEERKAAEEAAKAEAAEQAEEAAQADSAALTDEDAAAQGDDAAQSETPVEELPAAEPEGGEPETDATDETLPVQASEDGNGAATTPISAADPTPDDNAEATGEGAEERSAADEGSKE